MTLINKEVAEKQFFDDDVKYTGAEVKYILSKIHEDETIGKIKGLIYDSLADDEQIVSEIRRLLS